VKVGLACIQPQSKGRMILVRAPYRYCYIRTSRMSYRQGTGNILWKLGYQGDFTLENGIDPVDWFYAQHDANVTATIAAGRSK
jgi:hypothetical protein